MEIFYLHTSSSTLAKHCILNIHCSILFPVAPTSIITAQLMFVVGTDGGGLEHPNWKQNLKVAVKIQEKANEMYPGLFRDMNLSKSRYNQHVSNGAFIIEVGTTGNTLEEAKNSMKYLANVIESFK